MLTKILDLFFFYVLCIFCKYNYWREREQTWSQKGRDNIINYRNSFNIGPSSIMKINSVNMHINFKELHAVLVLSDPNICLHVFYILFFCSSTFVLRDKVSLYSWDWSWTHPPSAPAFQNLWFHVCITTSNCTLIVFSCVSTLKNRPLSEQY